MQIKKRYIKEEIERLDKQVDSYYELARTGQDPYRIEIAFANGRVHALEWILGFADD